MPDNNKKNKIFIGISCFFIAAIVLTASLFLFVFDFVTVEPAGSSETSSDIISSSDSAVSSAEIPVSSSQTVIPQQSPEAPDSYLESCIFTGDFIASGICIYNNINSNRRCAYSNNLTFNNISTEKVSYNNKQQTIISAASASAAKNIYVFVGTNDISYRDQQTMINEYKTFLRDLKAKCPNTNIYIASLAPTLKSENKTKKSHNNNKINSFNTKLKALAQEMSVYYIDINSALKNDEGVLPQEYSADSSGVFLTPSAYKSIYKYIMTHTIS